MMKGYFYLIVCIVSPGVQGQSFKQTPIGSFYGSGAYSNSLADVFSWSANQAALSSVKTSAGIYGERKYLLPELNQYRVVFALSTSSGGFGATVGYFGFSQYNETQIGFAYGRNLAENLDAGVQFNYNSVKINGYGSVSSISLEIGTILHISDKLHSGIQITNPAGFYFGAGKEKSGTVFSYGLGYQPSDKFFIHTELKKEKEAPLNVIAVFRYKVLPQLSIRAGVAAVNTTIFSAIGFAVRAFWVEVANSYHPLLGFSPALLLKINFFNTESTEN